VKIIRNEMRAVEGVTVDLRIDNLHLQGVAILEDIPKF
jgi:hypothetical protein